MILVGLVAYGIYKQAKRDWIIRFREKRGQKPGAEELDGYHDHFSQSDLDRFRTQAEAMMLSFAEVIVEDRRPEIEQAVRNQEFLATKPEIIQEIKERTSFWGSVTANMVAWGLSLAVTIAVIAIFNWSLYAGSVGAECSADGPITSRAGISVSDEMSCGLVLGGAAAHIDGMIRAGNILRLCRASRLHAGR